MGRKTGAPRDVHFPQIIYHQLGPPEEKACDEKDQESGEEPKFSGLRVTPCEAILSSLYMLVLVVAVIMAGGLLIFLLPSFHRPLYTCGNSIEQANQKGCSFDVLTKTWLPAACSRHYEHEFADFPATLNMTEWKYWTDLTTEEEITDEDMAVFAETKPRGQVSWVSTMRMHLAHCAFGLMRRSAALDAGERLDLATAPLDHTQHCIELLLEAAMRAPGIDESMAQGKVIFGAC
ncbi:hypothetical protein GGR51DRAFT_522264 [Nemania sp. FL0031]|nr:hypothetical protein GGR51DRAFT_522264 [Nemania sp. FL0031]